MNFKIFFFHNKLLMCCFPLFTINYYYLVFFLICTDFIENIIIFSLFSFFIFSGRILNRFSSDIEVIDNELGSAMAQVFSSLMNVIGALIAIVAATNGIFAPVAIPIILVYYYFSKYYRKTSTELKRLESVSKSPIFALFSEALTGASTIRAYDQETRIIATNSEQYNNNTSALMLLLLSSEWLSIRLDMTSAVISFVVALYAVLSIGTPLAIPAGWAGLALSFSFEMTMFLKHCVRM